MSITEKKLPHQQIESYVELVSRKVEDGHMNPLEGLIKLRTVKRNLQGTIGLIDAFESENLERLSSEADAWGGHFQGHDIQVRSGGKSFSFKNIPEWQQANAAQKAIEAKYKSYFEAAQKGAMMATEDGEEIILPEISYRKASVVISKPKK